MITILKTAAKQDPPREKTLNEQLSLGNADYYTMKNVSHLIETDEPAWKFVLKVQAIFDEFRGGKELWSVKEDYLSTILDKQEYRKTEQGIMDAFLLYLYQDEFDLRGVKELEYA